MPKQKLGTGNKRAVLQRPNTSYTSPRVIKQRQRQAQALDWRLQGHAYHRIAEELHCHPSTAHDLVVKALRDMVPQEKAEAVLQLELTRLDALEGAIFHDAANGDIPSIDACGFMGGGQIGHNWQFSPILVVGLEADFQGALERDNSTLTNNFSGNAPMGPLPVL